MNVYIFQAALLCEDCGRSIQDQISDVFDREDSGEYPQGPYPNGGGEADTPQHCDNCNVFLENPLTADGYDFVKERLKGRCLGLFTKIWAAFYDLA